MSGLLLRVFVYVCSLASGALALPLAVALRDGDAASARAFAWPLADPRVGPHPATGAARFARNHPTTEPPTRPCYSASIPAAPQSGAISFTPPTTKAPLP